MTLKKLKANVKTANSSIYHFENSIQIQKFKRFKNSLQHWWTNPPDQKSQDTPCNRNKMGH